MIVLQIVGFIVWLYILWVLRRADLKFQRFLLGSVGVFVFLLLWFEPIAVEPMQKLVAYLSGWIGKGSGLFDSYYRYCMLFIPKDTAAVSLHVDFECSGIIETIAFWSLLWFFGIYSSKKKIWLSLVGFVWILLSNIIRILVICSVIYFGGNDWFYFAHSVFGRMIFYLLTVALYFKVFTKGQILNQKVGSFGYGDESGHALEESAAKQEDDR